MPKVHFVKKARKDYPEAGIKKGESYYWWKFRYGGIQRSKTFPKKWQLTRSEFLSRVYQIEDELDNIDVIIEGKKPEEVETEIQSFIDEITMEIDELKDECQEKLDNMPEQLQDSSDAGVLLQERIEALGNWIDCLESIDISIDEELKGEDLEDRVNEILGEISDCCYEGE